MFFRLIISGYQFYPRPGHIGKNAKREHLTKPKGIVTVICVLEIIPYTVPSMAQTACQKVMNPSAPMTIIPMFFVGVFIKLIQMGLYFIG